MEDLFLLNSIAVEETDICGKKCILCFSLFKSSVSKIINLYVVSKKISLCVLYAINISILVIRLISILLKNCSTLLALYI